jgi:hypothetical protein
VLTFVTAINEPQSETLIPMCRIANRSVVYMFMVFKFQKCLVTLHYFFVQEQSEKRVFTLFFNYEIWSIKIFNLKFGHSSRNHFDVLPFDQISTDNCGTCEIGIK